MNQETRLTCFHNEGALMQHENGASSSHLLQRAPWGVCVSDNRVLARRVARSLYHPQPQLTARGAQHRS